MCKMTKMQLWCDGLKLRKQREGQTGKKRKGADSDDDYSDNDHPKRKSVREQREEMLKQAVDALKEKQYMEAI